MPIRAFSRSSTTSMNSPTCIATQGLEVVRECVCVCFLDRLWVEYHRLGRPANRVFTLERLKVAEAFCVDLALLKVNRALS